MSDRPVIIIDGLNLFMRHYAAHPAMSKNGDQVGGIVGFLTGVRRLSEKIGPSEIYVVWEGQGSAKKRHLYKEYKKSKKPKRLNRYYDDIPDSLSNQTSQISVIVKALRFTPIRQIYVEGCEADDAIGYMCRYTFKNKRKVIVSSDHDYYQLLNKNTLIYSPTLKGFVNKKIVKERYKVSAENFCLVKSVAGDQSDNIPGIRGLSYKTIAKMIPDTTSSHELTLDEFFDKVKEIHKIKNTKSTERLVFGETLVRRNWRLVRLDTNNLNLEHIKKINLIFESDIGVKDKFGMLRYLMKLGINTLNIDGLYLSLQSLTR